MFSSDDFFRKALEKRSRNNSLRNLVPENSLIDFCSTDYLGFARSAELKSAIAGQIRNPKPKFLNLTGSTGSRLMRGNYAFTEELEKKIASFHKSESALIFNSGYDANVGLFSCIPQREDIILHDELIHISSRDGMRLSLAKKFSFRHNDVSSLEEKLRKFSEKKIFVAVESVYSMDGDFSPIREISDICEQFSAHLIVDEAHATGVFGASGEGRVAELCLEKKVFAVVHTFGKALGCHGGAVSGSHLLRDYLINFSHSFIYSTAIPPINLIALDCAYDILSNSANKIKTVKELTISFKEKIKSIRNIEIVSGQSPIQCIIISGNERVKAVAENIRQQGYDVRAVLSPTVPEGKERLRICLHAFNTVEEVNGLVGVIKNCL